MAAYWAARDRFLPVGRDARPSADVRVMLAQVRDPLLDVLRISPDFRPASDPLRQMARALVAIDRPAGLALTRALADVQPDQRQAGDASGERAAP